MIKRIILGALLAIVAIGLIAPHIDTDFFQPKIVRALENGLGRRVEVGKAHFNIFTGPGFTVEDVTIFEDPRAGIEPFAYVGTLEARVQVLSLFRRKLQFSSIRLNDASINLVKTDAGPWNFQMLLSSAPASAGTMPEIVMRGARVDFKFGNTKSVFFFKDADVDVSPSRDGSVSLRFVGAPSRTDRSARDFGYFFVRGVWSPQKLDMSVQLERSALEEVARLIDRRGFGLHGVIALDARLMGPPSNIDVNGTMEVDDVHRWDLLPQRGGGWHVGYKGMLDLRTERLELQSTSDAPNPPLALAFRAWDFLTVPHWEASTQVNKVPAATLLEVARHMGAGLPAKLAAEGSVSGTVRYSEPDGLEGRVALQDASLTLPDSPPLRTESAAVQIGRQLITLEPSTVHTGENDSADLEGSYSLVGAGTLDLKITAQSVGVAAMQSFGLAAIPVLDRTPVGTWRGWARYRWSRDETDVPGWTGEYELQNARMVVEGLADPVKIQSAAVSLNGKRVVVSRMRAKAGAIAFTGDYHWEPGLVRPHKLHIAIAQADAAELERLLAPALIHERGFLARTLRLGQASAPEWMKKFRADGTVAVGALNFGDVTAKIDSTRFFWDGSYVRLPGAVAHFDQANLSGDLKVDLAGGAPHYRFDGKLKGLAYKGGKLDFDGSFDVDAAGAEISNGRAEGRVHARGVVFSPDAEFRTLSACFEMNTQALGLQSAGLRWKLSSVEATQGGETYTGMGSTQADGRLVLDLSNRGHQVRYSAILSPGATQ